MAAPEERFTIPGTRLPLKQGVPPTLLFHRWQRYDCFWPDSFVIDRNKTQKLTPFKRDFTGFAFLDRVAKEVQWLNQGRYRAWHEGFSRACDDLQADRVKAKTLWRLVVGWGTNPAFETGITLDHFLGFPFIPGSAVKGLLHRIAEQELLESVGDEPALPTVPPELPKAPMAELEKSLTRALRVRALFGSIHLRKKLKSDPESPFDRLHQWQLRLPKPGPEPDPWSDVRKQLARLCSDTPAGGMVTCFDAVPDPKNFENGQGPVLTPDVLTPHKDNKPIPIPFLAVRDGVNFELRYRLAWPSSKPRDREEEERASDLGGIDRETVAAELKRWLVRGLAELGLGGKTSAGYGYLLAEGSRLPVPRLLEEPPLPAEPQEVLSEAERLARAVLPDGIDGNRAVAALDNALRDPDPAVQTAVAARFRKLFSSTLKDWRGSLKSATRKRVEAIDRLLGGNKEDEP